jgi:putative spermidine/putrescine transport system permease protein
MNGGFWTGARRVFAVVFAIFMLLPLAVVLMASFTAESFVRFPPHAYGLRWYEAAFENAYFTGGFIFSIEVATFVALVSGIMGIAAALVLTRYRFRGRDAVLSALMMPLALPHIVLAIALLQLFATLSVPSSPYGLVAGHLLITAPYVLRLTMASLAGIDRQIETASASLGATPWQTLRLVLLPMIAPGAVAGILFAFLISFDEVTISLFTALPDRTTLPAQIFGFASQGSDPIVTAVSGVMILFAAGLVIIVERYFGVLRLIANEDRPTE